jgi:ketosteroid isomerase-like protein
MSQENVEIVRRLYDASARRDTATVLSFYDSEVEVDNTHGPARALMGSRRVYRGHDGLRTMFREWYEAWEEVEGSLEELIDAGERVISVQTYRGRGRASGAEVEWTDLAGVWTLRAGRIVRVAWFPTREEALEAAELAQGAIPQENVEIVRRLAAAVSRRDLPQILELTDTQVEWRPFIAALAEGGQYRGHDGIRQYLSDLDEAFETFRTNIDDLLGLGDLVVGVGRIHYCGRGSGVETEASVGWVLKLRDGKVLRVRAFREPEKALDEVGLRE